MICTTKAQRQALLRVYQRLQNTDTGTTLTYREFRKTVQPTFGCDDCIMVRFASMWLGIERDGYTHS